MTSRYVRDLAERVIMTALQTFGATLVASGFFTTAGVTDLSILQKAGIATLAAVLSLVKGLVAKAVGDSQSASLAAGVPAS